MNKGNSIEVKPIYCVQKSGLLDNWPVIFWEEVILLYWRSFQITPLFLMHSLVVKQNIIDTQHLFSISWAIKWHWLHLHQSGVASVWGCCEPLHEHKHILWWGLVHLSCFKKYSHVVEFFSITFNMYIPPEVVFNYKTSQVVHNIIWFTCRGK